MNKRERGISAGSRRYLGAMAAAVGLVVLLSGCDSGDMVGGPCEYRSWQTDAVVNKLQDEYVLLQQTEGEYLYTAEYKQFAEPPAIGDHFTLDLETITKGTCTPTVIKSIVRK